MKYNKWTQEEKEFVRKCRAKGMKWREICDKLEIVYGRKTTPQNIMRFGKKKAKVRTNSKWTEKETALLIELRDSGNSFPRIAQYLNRTEKAVSLKYRKLKQTDVSEAEVVPQAEPEPIQETPKSETKKWSKTRCAYTPQDDLGILIDLPNMNIDEMREKYQRAYHALARRYEEIWDSAEEERISLLKEAAHIIEARKREEQEEAEKTATEPRMGWFERRKMRRVARKAAKIQKRLNKMATKYGAILTNGDE
jgi:hypothetical protein